MLDHAGVVAVALAQRLPLIVPSLPLVVELLALAVASFLMGAVLRTYASTSFSR